MPKLVIWCSANGLSTVTCAKSVYFQKDYIVTIIRKMHFQTFGEVKRCRGQYMLDMHWKKERITKWTCSFGNGAESVHVIIGSQGGQYFFAEGWSSSWRPIIFWYNPLIQFMYRILGVRFLWCHVTLHWKRAKTAPFFVIISLPVKISARNFLLQCSGTAYTF